MRKNNDLGLDSIELKNGKISLSVSANAGPRILSLCFDGSKNLFAELPDDFLEFPGDGNFYFYGGHRFWLAPEKPEITYIPDNHPITIRESQKFVELIQDVDNYTGIQKSIIVRFTDLENVVVIDHIAKNRGTQNFSFAPWAITQFRLGGKAIIPQQIEDSNINTLLPDRSIALWPYTDIGDDRITWGNDFIFVEPLPIDQPLKIGVMNKEKWLAYFIDDLLFIKYASNELSEPLIDKGASHECYCNSKFIELETIGQFTRLKPSEMARHREVWRVLPAPFNSLSTKTMMDFLKNDQIAEKCCEMLKG